MGAKPQVIDTGGVIPPAPQDAPLQGDPVATVFDDPKAEVAVRILNAIAMNNPDLTPDEALIVANEQLKRVREGQL
eukprot:COSAG02_NODE_9816_length_2101_cov_1.614885_2_plen_76_part_00